MNRLGVTRISAYVLLGTALWVAVLKSGVHATLAGVIIAFCIPMRDQEGRSPLKTLEHDLHGPVAFAILPLFAFANSGLDFGGMTLTELGHPVTLGIILGLFIGKPIGIVGFLAAAVAMRVVELPRGVDWRRLLGVAFVCGIGFTMSMFIAGLAFEHGSGDYFIGDRLGILVGSIASAAAGFVILQLSLPDHGRSRPVKPGAGQ
jgi:NhaA family Na+:H+ antiporter